MTGPDGAAIRQFVHAGSKVHNVWNSTDSGHGPWMVPEHGVVLLIVKK